ncbi:MAG: alpha/beta hydrolase [Eubacteriales bacterium]
MLIHPSIEVFELIKGDAHVSLTAYIAGTSDDMKFNYKRKAVLVCPGGAYAFCSNREGEPIAVSLLAAGYNAFVLEYSVHNRNEKGKKFPGQLVEAALAMKFIKDNAEKFNIDPDYVFVYGFSAGGHLAASLGTLYNSKYVTDNIDMPENYARPAGMILSYPVIVSGEYAHRGSIDNILHDEKDDEAAREKVSLEKCVTKDTVPAFIWHTREDTTVPVQNSLIFASALAENGIPFELHIFPYGGHGASLANEVVGWNNPTIEKWFSDALRWMSSIKAEKDKQ